MSKEYRQQIAQQVHNINTAISKGATREQAIASVNADALNNTSSIPTNADALNSTATDTKGRGKVSPTRVSTFENKKIDVSSNTYTPKSYATDYANVDNALNGLQDIVGDTNNFQDERADSYSKTDVNSLDFDAEYDVGKTRVDNHWDDRASNINSAWDSLSAWADKNMQEAQNTNIMVNGRSDTLYNVIKSEANNWGKSYNSYKWGNSFNDLNSAISSGSYMTSDERKALITGLEDTISQIDEAIKNSTDQDVIDDLTSYKNNITTFTYESVDEDGSPMTKDISVQDVIKEWDEYWGSFDDVDIVSIQDKIDANNAELDKIHKNNVKNLEYVGQYDDNGNYLGEMWTSNNLAVKDAIKTLRADNAQLESDLLSAAEINRANGLKRSLVGKSVDELLNLYDYTTNGVDKAAISAVLSSTIANDISGLSEEEIDSYFTDRINTEDRRVLASNYNTDNDAINNAVKATSDAYNKYVEASAKGDGAAAVQYFNEFQKLRAEQEKVEDDYIASTGDTSIYDVGEDGKLYIDAKNKYDEAKDRVETAKDELQKAEDILNNWSDTIIDNPEYDQAIKNAEDARAELKNARASRRTARKELNAIIVDRGDDVYSDNQLTLSEATTEGRKAKKGGDVGNASNDTSSSFMADIYGEYKDGKLHDSVIEQIDNVYSNGQSLMDYAKPFDEATAIKKEQYENDKLAAEKAMYALDTALSMDSNSITEEELDQARKEVEIAKAKADASYQEYTEAKKVSDLFDAYKYVSLQTNEDYTQVGLQGKAIYETIQANANPINMGRYKTPESRTMKEEFLDLAEARGLSDDEIKAINRLFVAYGQNAILPTEYWDTWVDATNSESKSISSEVRNHELDTFYYLLGDESNPHGIYEALEYAFITNNVHNQLAKDQKIEAMYKNAEMSLDPTNYRNPDIETVGQQIDPNGIGNAVITSLGNAAIAGAPAALQAGTVERANQLWQGLFGDLGISVSSNLAPTEWGSTLTAAYGQALTDKYGYVPEGIPLYGGMGWGDIYQFTASSIQSLETMAAGVFFGNIIGAISPALANVANFSKNFTTAYTDIAFFSSAAAQRTREGIENGEDPNKALITGFAFGLNEALFEHLSMDKLYDAAFKDGLNSIIANMCVQFAIEGSEETFTSFFNSAADNLISRFTQDKSELEKQVADLTYKGYDKATAEKSVLKAWGQGFWTDFLGGGFSGALSAGNASTRNKVIKANYASAINTVAAENVDFRKGINDLTNQELNTLNEDVKKAQETVDKIESFKKGEVVAEDGTPFAISVEIESEAKANLKAAESNRDDLQKAIKSKNYGKMLIVLDSINESIIDDYAFANADTFGLVMPGRSFKGCLNYYNSVSDAEREYIDAQAKNPDTIVLNPTSNVLVKDFGMSEKGAISIQSVLNTMLNLHYVSINKKGQAVDNSAVNRNAVKEATIKEAFGKLSSKDRQALVSFLEARYFSQEDAHGTSIDDIVKLIERARDIELAIAVKKKEANAKAKSVVDSNIQKANAKLKQKAINKAYSNFIKSPTQMGAIARRLISLSKKLGVSLSNDTIFNISYFLNILLTDPSAINTLSIDYYVEHALGAFRSEDARRVALEYLSSHKFANGFKVVYNEKYLEADEFKKLIKSIKANTTEKKNVLVAKDKKSNTKVEETKTEETKAEDTKVEETKKAAVGYGDEIGSLDDWFKYENGEKITRGDFLNDASYGKTYEERNANFDKIVDSIKSAEVKIGETSNEDSDTTKRADSNGGESRTSGETTESNESRPANTQAPKREPRTSAERLQSAGLNLNGKIEADTNGLTIKQIRALDIPKDVKEAAILAKRSGVKGVIFVKGNLTFGGVSVAGDYSSSYKYVTINLSNKNWEKHFGHELFHSLVDGLSEADKTSFIDKAFKVAFKGNMELARDMIDKVAFTYAVLYKKAVTDSDGKIVRINADKKFIRDIKEELLSDLYGGIDINVLFGMKQTTKNRKTFAEISGKLQDYVTNSTDEINTRKKEYAQQVKDEAKVEDTTEAKAEETKVEEPTEEIKVEEPTKVEDTTEAKPTVEKKAKEPKKVLKPKESKSQNVKTEESTDVNKTKTTEEQATIDDTKLVNELNSIDEESIKAKESKVEEKAAEEVSELSSINTSLALDSINDTKFSIESLADGVNLVPVYSMFGKTQTLNDFLSEQKKLLGKDYDETSALALIREGELLSYSGAPEDKIVKPLYLVDKNGKKVEKVTADMVKDTPLGKLISLSLVNNPSMAGEDGIRKAEEQYQFLADTVNLINSYEDAGLIWHIIGCQTISAIKTNGDKQYRWTLDFSTICKKTQQLLDVMTGVMIEKGRGLTPKEIKIAYNEVGKAGESTPCPVCYVFARWLGIGSTLDVIRRAQELYGQDENGNDLPNTLENLRALYARVNSYLEEELQTRIAAREESLLKNPNKEVADPTKKTRGELRANVISRLESKSNKIINTLTNENLSEEEIAKLTSELAEIDNILEDLQMYAWAEKSRVKHPADNFNPKHITLDSNYKDTPLDILFNFNKADVFKTEYPNNWKFRNSKASSGGKAILPYSDMRVGDLIRSVATSDLNKLAMGRSNTTRNFDTKRVKDRIKSAVRKIKIQNLIGGFRFQSTSDFRFEYASDYLMALFELQALGANVQLYTKVIEAVDFLATAGCDVNLSVMPKGKGFIVDKNGNKVLDFSDTTGINANASIKFKNKYSNVQLIMVGINKEHIELCLENDDITFVIPYHASGNSKETLAELMGLLGESIDTKYITDFSMYQKDNENENATEIQKDARELRKKIITGKFLENNKLIELTPAEKEILENNKFLADLYRRFYIDAPSGNYGLVTNVEESFKNKYYLGGVNECYHNFVFGDAEDTIFPYEYWDKSLTIEEVYKNGDAFKEYCESLGLIPRFSGYNKSNKYSAEHDLSKFKGYWKTLIDRRMYDLNGKYRAQNYINLTNMSVDNILALTDSYAEETYGDNSPMANEVNDGKSVISKKNDRSKTATIVQNTIKALEYEERVAADQGFANTAVQMLMQEIREDEDYEDSDNKFSIDANEIDFYNKKAIEEFGTTNSFNGAGYLLRDGQLLNFSSTPSGRRQDDHRSISFIFDDVDGTDAMIRFMNYGNARLIPEYPGIDLPSVNITDSQYEQIKNMINTLGKKEGEFIVDFSDADGNNIGSYEYKDNINADKIISDIKYFYDNGTTREQSAVEQFHQILSDYKDTHESDESIPLDQFPIADTLTKLSIDGTLDSLVYFAGGGTFDFAVREQSTPKLAVEYADDKALVFIYNHPGIKVLVDKEQYINDYIDFKLSNTWKNSNYSQEKMIALAERAYNRFSKEVNNAGSEIISDISNVKENESILYKGDVRNVDLESLLKQGVQIDVFHASPSCQNFSNAKNDKSQKDNPVNITTAQATADAIRLLNKYGQGKVVTIENVIGYVKSYSLSLILDALDECGYTYDKNLRNSVYVASEYGSPTIRKRLVLVAAKDEKYLANPTTTDKRITWWDAIKDLQADAPYRRELPNWVEKRIENKKGPSFEEVKERNMPLLILSGNADFGLNTFWADEPSGALTLKSDAIIIYPNGKIQDVTPKAYAKLQGLTDPYVLPVKKNGDINKTRTKAVVGNGMSVELTQAVILPCYEKLLQENAIEELDNEIVINQMDDLVQEMNKVEDSGLFKFSIDFSVPSAVGMFINDSKQDFTEKILDGKKTIETRKSRTLDDAIGHRVGIVRTGTTNGKPYNYLVGYVDVVKVIDMYEQGFSTYEEQHLITDPESKYYGNRWGYVLANPERLETPIEILKMNKYIREKETWKARETKGYQFIDLTGADKNVDYNIDENGNPYIIYSENAFLKEKSINKLLKNNDYGENKSSAFLTRMNIDDYLKLTSTSEDKITAIIDEAKKRYGAIDESKMSDTVGYDTLHLSVEDAEKGNGKIDGHEGRHRVALMKLRGVETVPVEIRDRDNRYTERKIIPQLTLKAQSFYGKSSGHSVVVENLIPITESYREQLIENYGTPDSPDSLKFSIDIANIYGKKSGEYIASEIAQTGDMAELENYMQTIMQTNPLNGAYKPYSPDIINEADIPSAIKTRNKEAQKYGAKKSQKNSVLIPNKNLAGKTYSGTIAPIANSDQISKRFAKIAPAESVKNFLLTYTPISNAESIAEMESFWRDRMEKPNGLVSIRQYWDSLYASQSIPKTWEIALAEKLILTYANGDMMEDAFKVVTDLAIMERELGRAIQMVSAIDKLTPTGQIYYVQKVVDRLNSRYEQKAMSPAWKQLNKIFNRDTTFTPIVLDSALLNQLVLAANNSETREEFDEIMNQIKQNIADQLPVTLMDKWNAWRYLAMLGNPRTLIRNRLGNMGFAPFVKASEELSALIYNNTDFFQRYNIEGNRALHADKVVQENYDFFLDQFESVERILKGGKKNGVGGMQRDILNMRHIFKEDGWIEKWQDITANLEIGGIGLGLDTGDVDFLKKHFMRNMASYLTAKGVNIEDINLDGADQATLNLLAKAREFAIAEAQKATFRNANAVSTQLNKIRNSAGGVNAVGLFIDAVVPFTQTPVNILARGVEYSAVGLIGNVAKFTYNINQIKKNEANLSEEELAIVKEKVIESLDGLCRGLTGTGVILIGMLLSALGLMKAAPPKDDDEYDFFYLTGHQAYSVEVGKFSYTIDWFAPIALPLFVGAEFWDTLESGEGTSVWSFVDGTRMLLEPMMSLSMLDGINSMLNSIKYSENGVGMTTLMLQAMQSYVSQGIPTLLGQVARTIDPYRRTTYIDANKNAPSTIQRMVQKTIQKVPGLTFTQTPYVDAWGNRNGENSVGKAFIRLFENFISPGYLSIVSDEDVVNSTINELYERTGDGSILPNTRVKHFRVNGETNNLTANEYVKYQESYGKLAHSTLEELFTTPYFNSLNDEQKIEAINQAYSIADNISKNELLPEYELDKHSSIALNLGLANYSMYKAVLGDATKMDEQIETMINSPYLQTEDKAILLASTCDAPDKITVPNDSAKSYELSDAEQEEFNDIVQDILVSELDETALESVDIANSYRTYAVNKAKELYGEILANNGHTETDSPAGSLKYSALFENALNSEKTIDEQADYLLAIKSVPDKLDSAFKVGYQLDLDEFAPAQKIAIQNEYEKAFKDGYKQLFEDSNFKAAYDSGDYKTFGGIVQDLANITMDRVTTKWATQLETENKVKVVAKSPTVSTKAEMYEILSDGYTAEDAAQYAYEKYTGTGTISSVVLTKDQVAFRRSSFYDYILDYLNNSNFDGQSADSKKAMLEVAYDNANEYARSETTQKYGIRKGMVNTNDLVDKIVNNTVGTIE